VSTRDELISRRELLKLAGAVAIARGVRIDAQATTLTSSEAGTLDAICARLIPTDENGPGAREAQAWRYIDRALGGYLATSRQAYTTGLADIDRRAMEMRGLRFAALTPADQDAVLHAIEATPFFALVRTHTIQGTFCDPFYGGNAGFVGWDLLGYPGVRTIVTADEQKMGVTVRPNHKSAYDYAMFHKASDH
jgi:gluconate 2-dehydrogenase gamma chain